MKKILFSCLAVLTFQVSFAQKPASLYSSKQTKLLEKAAKQTADHESASYKKALDVVNKRGWFVERFYANGRKITLQGLDETGEPVYVSTFSNLNSARTTRTNSVQAGGSLGLNLSGNSASVANRLGVWDGGGVLTNHVEFNNRVSQQDNVSGLSAHATHVSGTMIASGVNAAAKGMATGASLRAWDFNNDLSEMTSAASGLLISNHSYGQLAGWELDEDGTTWRWYGDDAVSTTEDYKFGYYNSKAASFDQLAYNTPNYLICFSAGNSRDPNGTYMPGSGASYNIGSGTTKSTVARKSNGSYDNIPTYGTAKNILTVGAVSSVPSGVNQPSDIALASFSSSGPTDDGRIKPDIVGVGVSVLSSTSTGPNSYAVLSGTSMASPNVAGSLFLLQELYASQKSGSLMRSATLKGLVIHTAEEAGTTGPDYSYGWGLLNMERAASVLLNKDLSHVVEESSLNSGQTYTKTVVASGQGPLRMTISWTDPAGTALPVATTALNNRSPRLINDLDIRVSDGTTDFLPYVLDPENPTAAATRGDNIRDNVEQILLLNPVPGKTYTVKVSHKNTLQNNTAQAFSLIISGVGGKAYCSTVATNTNVSKMSKVVIGNVTNTLANGCSTNLDYTTQAITASGSQTIPYEVTVSNCNDQNTSKRVKIFADWNLDGDYDDTNESLASSATLPNGGVFSGTFTVPASVSVGQFIPIRLVMAEGTGEIATCGNYAAGQTQVYLLEVSKPVNDVGITAILAPVNAFCPGENQVKVTVKNYGTGAQSSVPVIATISTGTTTVATLTGQVSLKAFETKDIWLSGNFSAVGGTSYTILASTALTSDQQSNNNQSSTTLTATIPGTPVATAGTCTAGGIVTLRNTNTAAGVASWYDAPTGGNLLATGNATSITSAPASGTVYASMNEYGGSVGPATKNAFNGGGYNQFSPAIRVRAYAPVVLKSARLYIGNPGKITFTATNASGATVSSVTLDVAATRSPAAAGSTTDDPNDQGAVYNLGLTLPDTGSYDIAISYSDGATIYRNFNAGGLSGYPFTLNQVLAITGNTAGTGSTNYYYYLYDLQVTALGCPGGRVSVPVVNGNAAVSAVISPAGTVSNCPNELVTLQVAASSGATYQWFVNGNRIAGATNASYQTSMEGSYTVTVTAFTGCSAISAPTVISNKSVTSPTITRSDISLTSSTGVSYQWYLNNTAIAGATSQTYRVNKSGDYKVQVITTNGCPVTSESVTVVITAAEPVHTDVSLAIQPNPASDVLRILYQAPQASTVTASFYSSDGRLVLTKTLAVQADSYSLDVNVGSWSPGLYSVKISDEKRSLSRRFVKN